MFSTKTTSAELRPPSNGLPIGDLSDYSTLLESLQELRYEILSCRNGQVPINCLPVEILISIYKLVLPSDPEFTTPDNGRVFSIMKLTHVCRGWRSVLISSPAFWTSFHIVKTAPKFVAECLRRSGMLSIHVSFKWDSSDPDYGSPSTSVAEDDGSVASDDGNAVPEDHINEISSSKSEDSDDGTSSHSTLSVYPDHRDVGYSWTAYIKEAQSYHCLTQHSHRIATLDISLPTHGDGEDEEDNSFACGLFFYPLPALQTLKLRCPRGIRGSIPKVILDEHITTVNSLLLEDIPPTQILDLPLNLTSLHLRTTRHGTAPIDTSSFLRFLEKNRNLQSLILYNYNFPSIPNPAAPLALSNLRQLDVFSDSITFLRHLVAPHLGPLSSFKIGSTGGRLSLSAENSTSRISISVSCLALSIQSDLGEFLSLISEVFGSGWEEVTQLAVVIPVGEWDREFWDRFLDRLTKLSNLSVVCYHDRVDPWFDSLAASKERCPKLKGIRLVNPGPECCHVVVRSVRKLVKQRAEDGVPLEVVEQTGLSLSTKVIWDDLYDRWRIKDYLKTRDS